MGYSEQEIPKGSVLVRTGPDHQSWDTLDPYDFNTIATDEGDGVCHMYGAISWYNEENPKIRDAIRWAKAKGFRKLRWERVDPETWNIRDVVIML